ncbi:MAG: hypothetical protein M1508_12435 [Nitrospirae bacterium]|nr:hypothetical protein [Nitrospirota bacterium]
MLPLAHISHQTRGRLRIKIPSKRGDGEYLNSLKERFSGLEGIKCLEVNPLTGSALIIHNVNGGRIAEYARANNLFTLKGLDSYPAGLQRRLSGTFNDLNVHLKGLTGGEVDIGGIAFLALLGAGIYQIGKGNITALPWYAAFWYALNIFLKSSKGKE